MAYGGKFRGCAGTVAILPRRAEAAAVSAFFIVPLDIVFIEDDNRARMEHGRITGDNLTPEFFIRGSMIAWLNNRVRLGTKKAT